MAMAFGLGEFDAVVGAWIGRFRKLLSRSARRVSSTAALPVLQAHREHPLAKQWLEQTMPANLDQVLVQEETLGDAVRNIKQNIFFAREGRFEIPTIGGEEEISLF